MDSHTKDSLLAEILADLDAAVARSGEHASEVVERRIREFEKALVARALWRLAPCVQALHARCLAGGATSEEDGMRMAPDIVMFAVEAPDPLLAGLAVRHGDDRFATFVRSHPDSRVAGVTVAAWKPDAGDALAALPSPLPDDLAALVRLAGGLAPFAVEGSDFHLDTIAASIVSNEGRAPHGSAVASVVTRDRGAAGTVPARISVEGHGGGMPFLRYAEAMAPSLAAAAEPRPGAGCVFASAWDDVAADAIALDGRHVGPFCAELVRAQRGRAFALMAAAHAGTLARNHDDMIGFGYVWGERRLAYDDTDKRCFAIPTGDPRLSAMIHEDIDLVADANRFLLVLHRDAAGGVERIEAHIVARPAAALAMEVGRTADDLAAASEWHAIYEDAEADPPRLGQCEFARRLQAGEPLPPPAVAVDLRRMEVSPGSACDQRGLRDHIPHIARNDRRILDRIGNGEDRGVGCEDRAEFGDEDYESVAPGMAPGMG